MVELNVQGKDRMIAELESTESKCLSCDSLEMCQKDPNFDPDKVDGCINWIEKVVRESAVVE